MKLKDILTPKLVINRVIDINAETVAARDIQIALLDLDNTLAEDHVTHPTEYTFRAIHHLESLGMKCCIVSNAKSSRSSDFAKEAGIPCVSFAKKPSTSGILRALELFQTEPERAIFFGDQIFTDVVAANRAGVYSVLVKRITEKEVFYVVLKRPFESFVRFCLRF